MSLRMEDAVDVDHVPAKNSSKILLLHILSPSALEEMSSQQQYTSEFTGPHVHCECQL